MAIIKKIDSFRARKSFTDTENVTPSFAAVETIAKKGGEATRLFNSVFDSTSVITQDVVYWDSNDGVYKQALANGGSEQAVVGIANVEDGEVITSGIFEGIIGFNSGDTVYLDSTSPGSLTIIAPEPNTVRIGRVFYHASKALMCLVVDISNVAGDVFNSVNAENVTTSINSKAINTIFELDGITVKNSTNSTKLGNKDAGNGSGLIPINNGTVNTNLNSDMLDGLHSDSFTKWFLNTTQYELYLTTATFIVPAGIKQILVSLYGGGGGGAGGGGGGGAYAPAGGGGGGGEGGKLVVLLEVSPGEHLYLRPGSGGAYGAGSVGITFGTNGSYGGSSTISFDGSTNYSFIAYGGAGGIAGGIYNFGQPNGGAGGAGSGAAALNYIPTEGGAGGAGRSSQGNASAGGAGYVYNSNNLRMVYYSSSINLLGQKEMIQIVNGRSGGNGGNGYSNNPGYSGGGGGGAGVGGGAGGRWASGTDPLGFGAHATGILGAGGGGGGGGLYNGNPNGGRGGNGAQGKIIIYY